MIAGGGGRKGKHRGGKRDPNPWAPKEASAEVSRGRSLTSTFKDLFM